MAPFIFLAAEVCAGEIVGFDPEESVFLAGGERLAVLERTFPSLRSDYISIIDISTGQRTAFIPVPESAAHSILATADPGLVVLVGDRWFVLDVDTGAVVASREFGPGELGKSTSPAHVLWLGEDENLEIISSESLETIMRREAFSIPGGDTSAMVYDHTAT